MRIKKPEKSEAIIDLETIPLPRQQNFALYFLASRDATWAATKAGYSGDLQKRGRQCREQQAVLDFLTKYGSDGTDYHLDITEEAVLARLADIASKRLDKVTTGHVIDALRLIAQHLGMLDGDDMRAGKDRLSEIIAAFQAGPKGAQDDTKKTDEAGTGKR